ncbi:vitamin K epoxide reductase [Chitinophaga lutea]|uniref:Vitamin K epoxide reductase n=1 Tax=Chitinophaga lutea TaxID=2488634 RepID=A0A3N4PWC2_9BACT|nr:vitamin K epoxide reductase family protein [Chitinophaga lutea]RPE12276.1 vitamin K epoxide reductase [Chitinophaga lutea]
MNSFLKKLFEPKSNGPEIAMLLLRELNVPVTATTLTKELEEHPNYNSLLSISDVLNRFGVDNLAARFDGDKLFALPTPFIVQLKGMKSGRDYFSIVKKMEGDNIHYYEPTNYKWNVSKADNFLARYKGVALLAEAGAFAGEKDFVKKAKEEKRKRGLYWLVMLFLPLVLCIAGITGFMQHGAAVWPSLGYGLLALGGVSVGFLLLWYELDQHNPALQQICGIGKKTNCGAILQSGAATIGGVSWSVIGFSYFAGNLLLLLFGGLQNIQALAVLGWLSMLALPYVFFSLYYQWRIARQWCVLCLCAQAILVLQSVIFIASGWPGAFPVAEIGPGWIPLVLLAYGAPFMAVNALLPVFKKAKESKENKDNLQRLKHNPQIFDALLVKQKRMAVPPDGLGIVLGNPAAPHKIIKVCNPYCGPCARAHAPIEELLENNPNVQLQIIFTASNREGDTAAAPVKHLLAISEQSKGNEEVIKKGLDDWYLADIKDYEKFAAKHPISGESKQEHKIDAMRRWCEETGISFTPTFFVNGYQLPDIYSAGDLKHFLTNH